MRSLQERSSSRDAIEVKGIYTPLMTIDVALGDFLYELSNGVETGRFYKVTGVSLLRTVIEILIQEITQ